MAAPGIAERIPIIDIDTHIIEPGDLWSSRIGSKWGDRAPQVRFDERRQMDRWWFADKFSWPVAGFAHAGYRDYPPAHPRALDEADPACWDVKERVKRMDADGIEKEVIFPNIAGFASGGFMEMKEPELMLDCVRAYNDWQAEWSANAPGRFLPQAAVPIWDADACIAEVKRCADMGFRGVLFTVEQHLFGLTHIGDDAYWGRFLSLCQDLGMVMNLHIGAGTVDNMVVWTSGYRPSGLRANFCASVSTSFLDNSKAIAALIVHGICHRYPRLNWVSVESGVGWVPAFLEAMDWQWLGTGVRQDHPEYDLLPSEYFKRQIYASFWFEREAALFAMERLPGNVLYETDFPHPTSMSPGPASPAINPRAFIDQVFATVPEEVARKVLRGNAARIYRLD